jgi:ribosomal protein S18 acetylase RimI-like enzyme
MKNNQSIAHPSPAVSVRALAEADLAEADRIFHLAFGTFVGMPDPMQFCCDRDYVRSRWKADPAAAFAAEVDGRLVGSNFANSWGTVGFFGPLTVHPEFWDRRIASRLLEPVMQLFDRRQTRHAGLFTFPHSTRHVHLYQKFGFWPRFLTAIMSRPAPQRPQNHPPVTYSTLSADRQAECLKASRELTNAIYDGLDLQREILAVAGQRLGDTVFLWDDSGLRAFAVCHCGAGTEAGEGACYVKFGAARPGPNAADTFDRLLDACESLAAQRGLGRVEAGVNTARHDAYQRMRAAGFQTRVLGLAMQKPDEPGYNRPDVFLIDDWR